MLNNISKRAKKYCVNSFINPIAFSIFGFDIRWYGIAYMATFIISLSLAKQAIQWQKPKAFSSDDIDKLLNYIILGVILGGRIGYFLFYRIDKLLTLEVFRIRQGGMSFHGGVCGVTIAILLYGFVNKKKYLQISDIVCMCVPIGSFLGRIANYINGEIIGRKTNLFVPFLDKHPVVFYEAFLEGLVLFLILYKYKKLTKTGLITCQFLFFYGIFRFIIEFFRMPDGIFLFFTTAQWLSLFMIIWSVLMYYEIPPSKPAHKN